MIVITGDIAVVTTTPGNTPRLELWVRVAGGAGNAIDSDGDGLTDDEEAVLGTSAVKADTDGDGLLDNADDRPLIADNIIDATLSESAITAALGGPAITNVTLNLDSNDFPFFEWELSSNASWLTGMNLLFALVVPLDLANHWIVEGQNRFCSPLRVRSIIGSTVSY